MKRVEFPSIGPSYATHEEAVYHIRQEGRKGDSREFAGSLAGQKGWTRRAGEGENGREGERANPDSGLERDVADLTSVFAFEAAFCDQHYLFNGEAD